MKKLTLTFGVISSFLLLIGVLMKSQHYPGAGIVLTLSVVLFALVYAPMLFIDRNKLTQDKTQKLVNVMSMLALILIPLSFLFKIQHWPGAGIAIYIGNLLLLVLIPFLFMHGSKESDPTKKLNFYNEAVLLVVLTAFSFFLWLVLNQPVLNP